MPISRLPQTLFWLCALLVLCDTAAARDEAIVLQSTTSTANSGLYDAILPIFTAKTGITVHVIPVGTGQAIKNARNGDGDVLLVHARDAEEAFVADGWGVERFDVMYNDFVIVGSEADKASVAGLTDAPRALTKIASSGAVFVSRGDDSGTHKKEMQLWQSAAIDPVVDSGKWYHESGQGMGSTLNIAVGMGGYTLTDRGTWLSFRNPGKHQILVQGGENLFNQYGIIVVNPERHANVNAQAAQIFVDWILSSEGQAAIAAYKIDGHQLFYPNAK